MTPTIPTVTLRPKGTMPLLGFGTWQLKEDACRKAVEMALEAGYRHIDTADAYGNHAEVGDAIQSSGIARDQLFLTSKVWRDKLDQKGVVETCSRSLHELKTPYLDLLLMHWPNNDFPLDETLKALKMVLDERQVRAVGVSNFTASRLERALALDILPISVNQVEYHPLLNQKDLHEFCKRNKVVLTAYSPLAQGKVNDEPTIITLAEKYGKTPAQVTLRWLLQSEIVAIPKASSRGHIESNLDIFDFELDPDDFEAIDTLKAWNRLISWDVAEFDR